MEMRSLFQTEYAKNFGLNQVMVKVIKFVQDNPHLKVSDEDEKTIISLKPIVESPINVIFRNAKGLNHLEKYFSYYFFPKNVTGIPELFLAPEFTIDTFEVPQILKNTLSRDVKDKILCNLTPYLTLDKRSNSLAVTDTNGIHAQVVRGLLVRSYNESIERWLNPVLGFFIIKCYSMVISSIFSLHFHLSLQEQMQVALPLAYFYSTKMVDGTYLFDKCSFLGNRMELENARKVIEDNVENPAKMTVDEMCTLVSHMGPTRIGSFTSSTLFRLIGSLGTDIISSTISMEYPPYFVYQLLAALSNQKTRLTHILKSSRLLEEGKRFVHDLSVSPNFLPDLSK